MSQGESPAVARRRVRLALRRAREEKGLTQGEVAQALDWSLSKVQRIESGEVSVSSTDLRAVLAYLEITEPDTVRQLMEDARTSRRQRWFTDPRYREFLTPGTQQLLQFESEATEIRSFALTLVPGILQTAEFAWVTLEYASAGMSEETARVRHEVRMNRRQVFERTDPPEYLLVLDESVLWREIGGTRVTAEQLNELLVRAQLPSVRIRVIPFDQAAAIALLGPFTLFDLGDGEADAVLYREGYDYDEVIQTPGEVHHHRKIFEDLWNRSLDEDASKRLITARAAVMLSSLDRAATPPHSLHPIHTEAATVLSPERKDER